ncbi:phosphatase PAP2 family protein [Streptomyces xylophagus]|uniref:phosphatase PAP2 family protein n=1 Tax=Streptomyces xylophagus TaxID=285514 RepID=UPI000998D363|nr:phosphatase PAP2 family protein [Streptomyces xylophagus]
MRDTPRPQGTVGDFRPGPPQLRPGRALAHTTGASGSESPHRSDSRPPQTPRGARPADPDGRLGTTPPVPGRPTSFFWLFIALPALFFALITWQVAAKGPLLRLDARLSRALVHPDLFAKLLADLGDVRVALPVLAVVLGYVAWRARAAGMDRWWRAPLAATLLMALVPALVVPLKELIARGGTPAVPPGTGYYPSGHTATAMIAYGSATLLLLPWLRATYARRGLVVACALVNVAVPFGLVRHGYHWPLDVVASWCLCTVLLASFWLFLTRDVSRSSRRTSSGTPSSSSGPS